VHAHEELCDEIYCQLIKQTTNNKSAKADSCMKGWRLMSILSAYFKPSDAFKPYLLKYVESSACDTKRPHSSVAQYTLTSLRKTLVYGGRRNVPSQIELDAVTVYLITFFFFFKNVYLDFYRFIC
jgi:myosin-15